MKTFSEKIYKIAQQIPKGKVATYKQLAQMAGSPGAARAVGMLMKCNPDKSKIPCHRVVSSTGHLTGYAFGKGIITKKLMLQKEGVKFVNNKVDLKQSQW
ncbi:MAG: MGMT family protein [bacterium]|nr:MGMT family protein [bacterium]